MNECKYEDVPTFNFGVYFDYWQNGFDNSIVPAQPTLKHELIDNSHIQLNRAQYYNLYEDCLKIYHRNVIRAKDIGKANEICKIPPGSLMGINHLISLKLYTDYDDIQREFKKHCRKKKRYDGITNVRDRNMQIAHWCRYLKEACTYILCTANDEEYILYRIESKIIVQFIETAI